MKKIATAITIDLTKTIDQTSASGEAHFTRAFMDPNEKLANSIQATADLGESSFMWALAPIFSPVPK